MNSHSLMAIGRHDGGATVETLDEELADLNKAIRTRGGSGTVTLTITVKANGERGLQMEMDVKAKLPGRKFAKAFYYADGEGQLRRDDPDVQLDLTSPVGPTLVKQD